MQSQRNPPEAKKYRQGISTNMSAIEEGSDAFLSWKEIDYDFQLTKLGEFGWFQKKALFWLWLPAFVGGIVSFFSSRHSSKALIPLCPRWW